LEKLTSVSVVGEARVNSEGHEKQGGNRGKKEAESTPENR
jgi:hypothetical protein